MEARDYVLALIDAGLTQKQIAARSEIPQPTISKITRGQVKDVLSVNYRRLQKLHAEELSPPKTKSRKPKSQVGQGA